jgi:hypothetical protein
LLRWNKTERHNLEDVMKSLLFKSSVESPLAFALVAALWLGASQSGLAQYASPGVTITQLNPNNQNQITAVSCNPNPWVVAQVTGDDSGDTVICVAGGNPNSGNFADGNWTGLQNLDNGSPSDWGGYTPTLSTGPNAIVAESWDLYQLNPNDPAIWASSAVTFNYYSQAKITISTSSARATNIIYNGTATH